MKLLNSCVLLMLSLSAMAVQPKVPHLELVKDGGNYFIVLHDFPPLEAFESYECEINYFGGESEYTAVVGSIRGETQLYCLDQGIMRPGEEYEVDVYFHGFPEEYDYQKFSTEIEVEF
jgi:hypothetical protein